MGEKLFIDLWDYYDARYPFQIFIGGYGCGKSFSGLRGCIERGIPFIYMRRTDTALEECTCGTQGDEGNPFNPLNQEYGWDIGLHTLTKKTRGIYHRERDGSDMPKPTGAPIGIGVSLSSLAKVRGAGLARHKMIFYDEFIKEAHEKKMAGEFRALMRGYETVNRNKEFGGEDPTHLWLISNAEDIYNPIMVGLGIVSDCERMARKGQEHKYYKDRGLAVHLLESSAEFLKRKSETAIMRLMRGTQYADVGLKNQFANNDFSLVEYKRLVGYSPMAALDFAYIWRKKGEGNFHVSYCSGPCARFTSKTMQDEKLFRRRVGVMLQEEFMHGRITFESYELKEFIIEHIF